MRPLFSRRTGYGIAAVLEIAATSGRATRHGIAEAIGAPPSVVAQALADLVRGGIIHATAGRGGGYVLARDATRISVADVVAAVEPPFEERCALVERACADGEPCAVHGVLSAAREAFAERLAGRSIADLVRTPASLAPSRGGWLD